MPEGDVVPRLRRHWLRSMSTEGSDSGIKAV